VENLSLFGGMWPTYWDFRLRVYFDTVLPATLEPSRPGLFAPVKVGQVSLGYLSAVCRDTTSRILIE
jgi:hypothetical protein